MVKIENNLTNSLFAYCTNRATEKLIKLIPHSHLVGLGKIVFSERFDRKYKNDAALYWKKKGDAPAFIELSFYAVFNERPFPFLFIPFVGKFLLASALYHEVGHHYHHSLKHGITNKKAEIFAEKYKKDALKKAFRIWRIFLYPLAPFARYMSNKTQD